MTFLRGGMVERSGTPGGAGTVTSVSVTSANGISGLVDNPTTTPNIILDVSGLDAAKIADGSVSNTEFQYLDGVTSSIQTQINNKFSLPALTSGSVLFSDGSTIVQDNTNFFFDNTNKTVGLSSAASAGTFKVANQGLGSSSQLGRGRPTTSDIAAGSLNLVSESAYAQGTVNPDGPVANIISGLGRRLFTSVSNTAGAVTVTVGADFVSVALVSGVDFTLGTDNTAGQKAVTATNLAAAINANSTLNTKVSATASAANVYINKLENTKSVELLTNQSGRISLTQGADGYYLVSSDIHIGEMPPYLAGSFWQTHSRRLYFDRRWGNGSIPSTPNKQSYIQAVQVNPGANQETNLQFVVNGSTILQLGAGGNVVNVAELQTSGFITTGDTIRSINTGQMRLRGEFNTITLQGEKNTAGTADVKILAKNPSGGATAGRPLEVYNDTTLMHWVGPNGDVVFNEAGNASGDLRVEGDTDANLVFVDASADFVGIGTSTPSVKLDVVGAVKVSDDAYSSSWNGNNEVPTKNALYDKIQSIGSLQDFFTDAGNSGTSETDLYSYTVPASTLGANGDKLEAEYGGVFVSSGTATRQIKIYFGGTAIFDTGALTLSLSSAWTAYVTITRVSSSVVRYMISFTTEGAALSAYTSVGELTGLTLSNTNILKITGQAAGVGAATNDIVAKMGTIGRKATS